MSSRDNPPDDLKEVKNATERVSGEVRERASDTRPGRSAAGGHVSEGDDDQVRQRVSGGASSARNVPMFGVGVALVILVLIILAFIIWG
jgi:hypothetical protein